MKQVKSMVDTLKKSSRRRKLKQSKGSGLPHALQPNPKGDSTMDKARKMLEQFRGATGGTKMTQDMGMGKPKTARSKSKLPSTNMTTDMGMGKNGGTRSKLKVASKNMTSDMGMGNRSGLRSKIKATKKDRLPTMKKF